MGLFDRFKSNDKKEKKVNIPDEIEVNNCPGFKRKKDIIFFSVQEIDEYWEVHIPDY